MHRSVTTNYDEAAVRKLARRMTADVLQWGILRDPDPEAYEREVIANFSRFARVEAPIPSCRNLGNACPVLLGKVFAL